MTATLTLAQGAAQWFRHPSRQNYDGIEMSWPSRTINLSVGVAGENPPSGYMVGVAAPSFPTFQGACAAFFYDQWVQTGAGQQTVGQVKVRVVDGRARIRRVVVRAASLDAWVGGRQIKGCLLELNSSAERVEVEISRSGKVTIPLRTGIGQDPWLWLKTGGEWIDFRAISRWGGQRESRDVEFEVPTDAVAEVTALATQGESTLLEYKVELPDDTLTSKRKMLKTVVAFANGDGGTLLFGVDGDDDAGAVVGLAGKPAVLLRRLNSLIRDRIVPAPSCTLGGHFVEDKFVIRLDVTAGAGSLYALALDANRPEYYVRRNGSTYYARPEELADVAAKRVRQSPQGLPFPT